MKRRFKSILTIMLTLCIALSTVACKPDYVDDGYDGNSTLLTVYSYGGGVGNVWLEKAKARFEADFANTSFEDGKTGVYIRTNTEKEGNNLSTIAGMEDVLFAECVEINNLFANNLTVDISDIVNVPLNELLVDGNGVSVTDDTDTIEDKLYDEQKSYFTFSEEKYKGLPHYSHFATITFNRALFNEKNLYFAKETAPDANPITNRLGYFIFNANDERTCGPDGVYGNEDDGLPATYEEFFILCDYMVDLGIKPFVWNGAGKAGYTKYLLNTIYLNLAGKEKAQMNWNFTSSDTEFDIVTDFKDGEPVIGKGKLDNTGGGDINAQLEKYYAVEIFDKIIDSEWLHDDCTSSLDNYAIQEDYVKSYGENSPIAFLAEGSYWYNEAIDSNAIQDAKDTQDGWEEMNDYEIMPLPRVYKGFASNIAGTKQRKLVVADQSDSIACINARIKEDTAKVKLAKLFLAYLYTEESLVEFTKWSNTVKMLKYGDENTESKLNNDYAKMLWNYCKEADYVFPYSRNQNYLQNSQKWSLHISRRFWHFDNDAPYEKMYGMDKTAENFFKSYMIR